MEAHGCYYGAALPFTSFEVEGSLSVLQDISKVLADSVTGWFKRREDCANDSLSRTGTSGRDSL